MPRTTKTETETTEPTTVEVDASAPSSNGGGFVPKRAAVTDDKPKKGRPVRHYEEWASEIADLRDNLPNKWAHYEDVPGANGLARGLAREYGVLASTTDVVKDGDKKGHGKLLLCFDPEQVEAQKEKYKTAG